MPIFKKLVTLLFPQRGTPIDFAALDPLELATSLPRAKNTPISKTFSVLSYKHPTTRSLIWHIKYKKDSAAIRHGGYILYTALNKKYSTNLKNRYPILIPIPTSPARRRERGYNQCEFLASALLRASKETKIAPQLHLDIRTDILFRTINTPRQTMKNRADRLSGVHGIFTVRKELRTTSTLHDRPIIIIDDVLTTGSTLREAFHELHNAGFKNVSAITLAH